MQNISEKQSILLGLGLILLVSGIVFFRTYNTEPKPEAFDARDTAVSVEQEFLQTIEPREALNLFTTSERTAIIDIRDVDSFGREHVIRSRNIPLERLSQADFTSERAEMIILVDYDGSLAHNQTMSETLLSGLPQGKSLLLVRGGFQQWRADGVQTISEGDLSSFADQGKVSLLSPEELKVFQSTKQINDYAVVDVRSEASFRNGHIPGALHIPLSELEFRAQEIPFGKIVIAYGVGEVDTFQATVRLYDLNYIAVRALNGGMQGWEQAGGTVVR